MKKPATKKSKKIQKKKVNKKPKKIIFVLVGFLLTTIVFLVVIGGYFYKAKNINISLKKIYKLLPLPVASLDRKNIVTSNQLFNDLEAVQKFYETKSGQGVRVDFSTEEGKIRLKMKEKDILNKLIEDSIVQKIARAKGIKISSQDVDKAVEKSLSNADSDYQKLAVNLQYNYGWTIQQFKDKVVKNQLYLKELFKWYSNNIKNSKEYKKAEKAKNSLAKNDFKEVVAKFSEGASAKKDGEIAWIKIDDIIPEVANKIQSMKEGEVSDIIISPLGMHIVKLEGVRNIKNGEIKNKKEVQLRQIFIRGENFIDWLEKQKKNEEVKILIKEYYWDKETGEVKFRSQKMQELSKKIKIKSQGDPSL